MLQWSVLKFREIQWLSKSHIIKHAPPPPVSLSNSLAPSFLWMRPDAQEKMPQPKKELKSSFYHLSLYFNTWSKIQVSSEAKPLRKTTGFQLCPSSTDSSHGQPCHNSLFNAQVTLLRDQWSDCRPSWLRAQNLLNQRPHDGSTKN